jgi:tetratricopeptide (TPR) repeat protein
LSFADFQPTCLASQTVVNPFQLNPSADSSAPTAFSRFAAWCVACLLFAAVSGRAASHDLAATRNLFLAGEYQKVIPAAKAAIAENYRQDEWSRMLCLSLLKTGQYPEAVTVVSNALKTYRFSIPVRMVAHDVYQSVGRTEDALENLRYVNELIRSRSSINGTPDTLATIGRALLILGADPKDVLDKIYQQAAKQDSEAREPRLAIGDLALSKKDYALAAKTFTEGTKKFPTDADFFYGLAASQESDDRGAMLEAIAQALALNPNHDRARLLLADHAIAAEEYEEADKQLDKAIVVNPWQPEAWAYRAVLAHLRNQPEKERDARQSALHWWTNNPAVDHLIGTQLSQKYRFAEGADHQRQALAFDPDFVPAKIQLAQDLLRLGQTADGWELVEEAHKADQYDVESFNLATLKDSMTKFATLTNEFFVVRMSQHEAAVYGDRVMSLLDRARTNLCAKYGLDLKGPVTVEIFPDQRDFGVRTFGMPHNPGFLGVCFGKVITANSPASSGGNPSNWEAVLWHEFCHVVTLTITKNKMPRWLSEGISVYEELQANPTWGQHMTPAYRKMVLGDEFTPLGELSSAFLTAKNGEALQFAYYESALAVEFLSSRYGTPALREILRDLGTGTEINAAIAAHTAPIETVEKEFAAFAKERAEKLAPELEFDEPKSNVPTTPEMLAQLHPMNFYILGQQARALLQAEKWNEALVPLLKLQGAYPGQTGNDSALALMAVAYRGLGETNNEQRVLEQRANIDTTAVGAFSRLMILAAERHDWPSVRLNAQRYIAVNPLAPEARRHLAEALDALDQPAAAALEWMAYLALNPADLSEAKYRVARSLHRSGASQRAKVYALAAIEETPRYRDALTLLEEIFRVAPPGTPFQIENSETDISPRKAFVF